MNRRVPIVRGLILVPIVLLSTLSGCASTRLTLNLDLYTDDPTAEANLSPARVLRLRHALDTARTEAAEMTRDRLELGDRMYEVFASLHGLLAEARRAASPPSAPEADTLAILRRYRDQYHATVETKAREVTARINAAHASLDSYVQGLPAGLAAALARVDAVVKGVALVKQGLEEIAGDLGTDFEKTLVLHWPAVVASASEDNLRKVLAAKADSPEVQQLRERIQKLAATFKELADRGRRLPEPVTAALTAAVLATTPEPAVLKRSIDAVARAATAIPLHVGLGDRGLTAVNELVRSTTLFFSQIDRLQDPADPVWRIVADPRNESKWNTTFSETHFYSEGNTSVVVVRDTPISFRVQRGANNPAALVQGQLQVSRALANAAVSVAGAALGAPLPRLPGQAAARDEASGATDSELEALLKRKAAVERLAASRAVAVRGLRQQLTLLRGQLQRVNQADQAAVNALLAQFRSVLKAYEAVFAPSAPGGKATP